MRRHYQQKVRLWRNPKLSEAAPVGRQITVELIVQFYRVCSAVPMACATPSTFARAKGAVMPMVRMIVGGADTHADQHVAAAIDTNGGILGIESFSLTNRDMKPFPTRRGGLTTHGGVNGSFGLWCVEALVHSIGT
jgi:hypothetical protein